MFSLSIKTLRKIRLQIAVDDVPFMELEDPLHHFLEQFFDPLDISVPLLVSPLLQKCLHVHLPEFEDDILDYLLPEILGKEKILK